MTRGAQIPAFALVILVSACSIERDVPGFSWPESTLSGTAAEQPVLQPTTSLIVDASADDETYQDTVDSLDGRAGRLRQAVQPPSDP